MLPTLYFYAHFGQFFRVRKMDKSIRKAELKPATAKGKKYKMTFLNSDGKVVKTT
jgi:hypothetical protein